MPTGVYPRKPLRERLFSRLIIEQETGCLLWTGCKSSGYGRISDSSGKTVYVHRLMYQLFAGPIPDDTEIDHLCRNHACAAPAHLEAVTHRQNTLRGTSPAAANAVKDRCINDHEYDVVNTCYLPDGSRFCRACNQENTRRHKARGKAAP